jgi:hypothetical protein
MSDNVKPIGGSEEATPSFVYQIKSPMKTRIYDYLCTKPFSETNLLCNEVFEKNGMDAYLTDEALTAIIKYLGGCPRNEVRDILLNLNDNIERFEVSK